MAITTKCGLTVADYRNLSLGFILDICQTQMSLIDGENIHQDEEHYYQLKDVLPFMVEKYKKGSITKEKYDSFMKEYEELKEIYEF